MGFEEKSAASPKMNHVFLSHTGPLQKSAARLVTTQVGAVSFP